MTNPNPKAPTAQDTALDTDGNAALDMTDTQPVPSGSDPTPTQPSPMYTEEEMRARLEKARSDEKKKVYDRLEKVQSEKDKLAKKVEESENQIKELQEKVDALNKGDLTEKEAITGELKKLRETLKKQEAAMESLADDAAKQIQRVKLDAYREKRLAQEGVQLTELVVGNTEEEIDSAIEKAKQKEGQIRADATAKANADRAAGASVPRPVSPSPAATPKVTPVEEVRANPQARREVLKGSDYRQTRQALLADAKKRAGIG